MKISQGLAHFFNYQRLNVKKNDLPLALESDLPCEKVDETIRREILNRRPS